jgi:hypothetical protein
VGKLIPALLGKVILYTLPKERTLPIIVFPINGEYGLYRFDYFTNHLFYKGIMLLHRPTRRTFHSRKEAKDFLGGTNKYNRAFKDGDIYFMND